jgi:hypothetical protein
MLALYLAAIVIMAVSAQNDLLRTQLVGFDGCGTDKGNKILGAWRESWGIMDVIRKDKVNWNEAAALEYLGPPGYNSGRQGDIQGDDSMTETRLARTMLTKESYSQPAGHHYRPWAPISDRLEAPCPMR